MSTPRVPLAKGPTSRRSSSSRASTSSLSDSDDAITPCPLETPKQPQKLETQQPSQQAARRRSWRNSMVYLDPVDADKPTDDVDAESLWRRMLTVQKRFGCYKSARMMAALEMGDVSDFVPSKTCLDLLNDSLNHLPDEEKKQVEEYLEHENATARRSTSWMRRSIHA